MDFEAFEKKVDREVEEIRSRKKWKTGDNNKGKAFEIWLARALHKKFSAYSNSKPDLDPDDYVQASYDLKLDIVIPTYNEIYLIQAKYGAFSDGDVKEFFGALVYALDEQYTSSKTKNEVRRDAFAQLRKYKNTGRGEINLWFFAKNKASDACMESLGVHKRQYSETNINVDIFDLEKIMEFLQEEHEPVNTEFPLEKECWFEPPVQTGEPYRNITLWIKGSVIRDLLEEHGKIRVFNENIRTALGNPMNPTKVNEEVVKTLVYAPDKFFYYNNGISAICQEYTVDKKNKRLVIKGLQIINGAQTCGSLFADEFTDKEKKKRGEEDYFFGEEEIAKKAEKAQILVKLTEVKDMKDNDDFTSKIVRYNNTQNPTTPQDFRSNDPIQKWLKNAFKKKFEIYYHIKRPYKEKKGRTDIRIGEFARAWLSWQKGLPWETSEAPKLMKDDVFIPNLTEEVSFYEHIFGKEEDWKHPELLQAAVAIHALPRIENCLKGIQDQYKEEGKFQRIKGFKMFALALFKIYFEKKIANPSSEERDELCEKWLQNEARDDKNYAHFLSVMADTIKTIYEDPKITGDTPNTTIRHESAYKKTKAEFEKNLKANKG